MSSDGSAPLNKTSTAGAPARRFRYLLLCFLVFWALLSLFFRFVLADIDQYKPQLEQLVSEKTDFYLNIGQLSGRWLLFSPVIELNEINLVSKSSEPSDESNEEESKDQKFEGKSGINIAKVALELDLLESIFTLSPRIKRLLVSEVALEVSTNPEDGKLLVKGLPLKPSGKDPKETIKAVLDDYLLTAEQIYLLNSKLDINLTDGRSAEILIPRVSLDSEWFNHELNARVVLNVGDDASRALMFSSVFQGNPFDEDSFSARGFVDLAPNSLGFLFRQPEWPELSGVKLLDANLNFKSWFRIDRGELENVKLKATLKDLFADYSQIKDKQVEKLHLETLELTAELSGNLQLQALMEREGRKEYIKKLVHSPFELKVGNLNLKWNEFEWNNLSLLIDQGRSASKQNPLREEWRAFYDSGREEQVHLLRLLVSNIPINLVQELKDYIPQLKAKGDLIEKMQPEGKIERFQLLVFDPLSDQREIFANGYGSDLGVSSFAKTPGFHGVDFYFEYAPNVIGVSVDTNDLYLEKSYDLFREDLSISRFSGNLLVEVLPGDIVVHSDVFRLISSEINAQGMLSASIPDRTYSDGNKELPAWSIQVNFEPTSVENIKMFFLTKLPVSFLEWVDNFLDEGDIEGDLFLYAFSKKQLPHTFLTLGGDLRLNKASLDYLPGKWPKLEEVNGQVSVHNDQVKAYVPSAKVFNTRIYDGKGFIKSYLSQNLPRVQIAGKASGDLLDVQRIFLESELKDVLGHVVEDWVVHGEQFTDLNLDIPLLDSPNQAPSKIEVNLSVDDALLAVPSVKLGVKSLSSNLHYSLKDGLSSENISASFFDKTLKGKIETREVQGEQVIQIFGSGSLAANDLRSWESFWLFDNMQGQSDFEAVISVGEKEGIDALIPIIGEEKQNSQAPTQSSSSLSSSSLSFTDRLPLEVNDGQGGYDSKKSIVRIGVSTGLNGLALDLPGAYKKQKSGIVPTKLQLDVLEESLIYRLNYGGEVGVVAQTTGEDFDKARIHFGTGLFPMPPDDGLTVTGFIGHVDFDEWVDYIEENLLDEMPDPTQLSASQSLGGDSVSPDGKINNLQKQEASAKENKPNMAEIEDPASIVNRMDVSMGLFTGFDQSLQNIKVFVTREHFLWRVDVENKMLKGLVLVPDEDLISADNPITAKLEYLKISEEQLQSDLPEIKKGKTTSGDVPEKSLDSELVESEKQEAENDDAYKPDDFVFAQLDVESVSLGDSKHGRWRIDLFPDENGMDFKVHQLNYGLMTINGKGRWNYSKDKSETRFKGHLRTAAVTKLFSALNLKPSANSTGLMAIDLKWPGSPMDFDYDKMKGTAGLEIFDGSIVEVDIKSKKFRALGIFNLGIITDILTLKVFKKIGKGIDKALTGSDDDESNE
jgi:uncharacterized protein YhdP